MRERKGGKESVCVRESGYQSPQSVGFEQNVLSCAWTCAFHVASNMYLYKCDVDGWFRMLFCVQGTGVEGRGLIVLDVAGNALWTSVVSLSIAGCPVTSSVI